VAFKVPGRISFRRTEKTVSIVFRDNQADGRRPPYFCVFGIVPFKETAFGFCSIMCCHPLLTGTTCIASNTRATMSTLQAVAPIPAFIAGSMLWFPRRAFVASAFEGIGFAP
jgi:hypothetical protein